MLGSIVRSVCASLLFAIVTMIIGVPGAPGR